MLCLSAITPHPPILIPNIGGENLKKIPETQKALQFLGQKLQEKKIETLIIISPHGLVHPEVFTIQISNRYYGDFQNFGDLETELEFAADIPFINKLKIRAEKPDLPLQLVNESFLDHGSLVPLYYLSQNLPSLKIVPLAYSFLDYQTHFYFGEYLRKTINRSNKRIALIASGDLSHALSPEAPAGFSPQGKIFDQLIIKLLTEKNFSQLVEIDPHFAEEAKECGLRSFIILAGALASFNCEAHFLSYENPFGVGYLTMYFD